MSTSLSYDRQQNAESLRQPEAIPWSHVSFGPAGDWVDTTEPELAVPAKEGAHLTYLKWERQINLEVETSYHTTSVRLETSVAVQHQSQWRLDLDPRRHRVVLHWLRVRRGTATLDHLHRDRMRLIQRETQLDHLVIDGQWTLLAVLDDVRVGDVIEAGYSFVGGNPIRPAGCEVFFVVPPLLVVGRYRLRIEFVGPRDRLNCMASADAPTRVEEVLPGNRVRWTWQDQQFTPREAEPNQPSTFLDYIWIQVSDLNEWQPLATRLAELWPEVTPGNDLSNLAGLVQPATVTRDAVQHLIWHIQDNFRYLSVDLESGGWIPASPVEVAPRRYGDCKDLVWLAVSILRQWSVRARPILVAAGLRERVRDLRPMALLFNHVVLEVELDGVTRWFDMTLRHQGGNFTSQTIRWFGAGLPVEVGASLQAQPGTRSNGLYVVRETIELDTRRGEPSMVEVCVYTEGWNSDHLRGTRIAQGTDDFAKERLAHVRRRYGKAERIGNLVWRDDRARNVCELAEAFQVRDVVYAGEGDQRAIFDVPGNVLIQMMAVPEQKQRRGPWDLPRQIEVRHEICIRARSLGSGPRTRRRWVRAEFTGTVDDSRESGCWRKIMRLSVQADDVSAGGVEEFRDILDRFLVSTTWRLYLPWNEKRPKAQDEWGALPDPNKGVSAYVSAANPAEFEDATASTSTATPLRRVFSPARSTSGKAVQLAIPLMFLVSFVARNFNSTTSMPESFGETRDGHESFVSNAHGILESQVYDPEDALKFFETNQGGADGPLPPGATISGQVYRDIESVDRAPEPISQDRPKYPQEYRAARIEGEALIEFVVSDGGVPGQVKVLQETNPAFGKAASFAVLKWRFRPALKDGHPVNMALRQPVSFKLAN